MVVAYFTGTVPRLACMGVRKTTVVDNTIEFRTGY